MEANLIACLTALLARGEAGLQDALDKIYGPESRPKEACSTAVPIPDE